MRLALPLLLAALLIVAPAPAQGEAERDLSGALVQGANAFAWDLYAALDGGQQNLFFSPFSVHAALLMTREGARGQTAAQMDRVLHTGADLERGRAFMALQQALAAPMVREGWGRDATQKPAYELHVANRLWGQQGYAFEGDFIATLGKLYKAPLERIDFGNPAAARAVINAWVEKATREKIKDIVPDGMPHPLTRLALANAIYFKGQWEDPFNERGTQPDDFTTASASTVRVPFMRRIGGYRYAEKDGVQVLEIPYRRGHTSMVVFLPRAKDGLKDLEAKLTEGAADGWLAALGGQKVNVSLPKFQFTTAKDLTGVLPGMGMPDAFALETADFSGMTKTEKLFIGAVLHKAFVAVDEKGTEAAAATVVMMKAGAAPRPQEPVVFKADHPFAFVIRHRATGAILFAGRVTDPSQS